MHVDKTLGICTEHLTHTKINEFKSIILLIGVKEVFWFDVSMANPSRMEVINGLH